MCDYWYLLQSNFQTSSSLTFHNYYLSYCNLKIYGICLYFFDIQSVPLILFFPKQLAITPSNNIFQLKTAFLQSQSNKKGKAFVNFKINIWVIFINFYPSFCSLSFHFHLENDSSRTQILVLFVPLVIIRRYLGAYSVLMICKAVSVFLQKHLYVIFPKGLLYKLTLVYP